MTTRAARALGRKMVEYRKANDLTQNELAELTGLTRNNIQAMEQGQLTYKTKKARKRLYPIAELFGIAVHELIGEAIDEGDVEKDMDNKLVKELSEEIAKLKEENKHLEERADMWKSRVDEIKAGKTEVIDGLEIMVAGEERIQKLQDTIDGLKARIKELEENQMTPETKLLMKLLMEKYA